MFKLIRVGILIILTATCATAQNFNPYPSDRCLSQVASTLVNNYLQRVPGSASEVSQYYQMCARLGENTAEAMYALDLLRPHATAIDLGFDHRPPPPGSPSGGTTGGGMITDPCGPDGTLILGNCF